MDIILKGETKLKPNVQITTHAVLIMNRIQDQILMAVQPHLSIVK